MPSNRYDKRPRMVRHLRVRSRVHGDVERPRLSVFRSNKRIYAQIIDDTAGRTIVAASSAETGLDGSKIENAKAVGAVIGKKALEAGIKKVVFDRGGYKFHGRVKALADAARAEGLDF